MSEPAGRRPSAATLIVAGISLAAMILRVTQLHQSLYGDEVLAYHEVVGQSLGHVIRTVKGGLESSPPLFFIFAWLSAKLGDPSIWIRLPSLLLGTATIPVIYLLGRAVISRGAGIFAAAIFAVSPFATYYGVEARPYAALGFFVALSTLALVRAVDTHERRWWALYVVSEAAAAYTHYTAIFALLAQGAWSLWARRDRLREPLLAIVGVVVLYLPWLPQVHGTQLGLYGDLEQLNLTNVSVDVQRAIAGYPYATLRQIPTATGLIAVIVCSVAGVVALLRREVHAPGQREATIDRLLSKPGLLAGLALATPVGLLLTSVIGTDIWNARGLYASVPAGTLALGALLATLPKRAGGVALAVTMLVLTLATIRAISPAYARPPFRSLDAYLDTVAAPDAPVILYPSFLGLFSAIPVELHRRHRLFAQVPRRWPTLAPGATAYVVVEYAIIRALHATVTSPPGYRKVADRHYGGLLPFDLLTYRFK